MYVPDMYYVLSGKTVGTTHDLEEEKKNARNFHPLFFLLIN